ncbi:Sugar (and other) transporter family protein [Aspergillus niger]|uniref:Sugar (And other) transporter family protein n=1 Tax=Aspergillus niger TaxID=5061 RepID=A0A505I1Q5_ASPNG|nr:Sugar (and other) transporter family protein [Aspergillus niger]
MSTYIYKERDREREWDEPHSSTVSIKRYVIPSEDERERDFFYRREDPGDREVVIRRSVDRDEPLTVQRYEREVDYDSRPYDYRSERDYYEREYYAPERIRRYPAPIVIREAQPVIFLEARGPVYVNPRESDYEVVRRSEVDREPGGYYYHRRVREYDDDRRSRRELSPSDSISQAARHRDDQEAYSSDDSMVYIRKEVREYDDSPHHRRHLAEGALAGVGAAELLRNHRKKEGEEVADGVGRLGRDVGAAAIAGAVALARSKSNSNKDRRSRSRHRRASSSRRSLRDTHEEKRSQSQRRKHMAEAGLAGAAVAGLVEKARSRSRSRRRESRSHSAIRKALPVVAAGLGTAAATGLYEKNKEKKEEEESRRRERRRSRSRSRAPSEVYPDPTRDSPGLIEYGDHPVHGSIPPNYYGRPVSPHGYYSDASDPVASGAAGHRRRRSRHGKHRSRSRDLAEAALAATGVGYAAHKLSQRNERKKADRDRDRPESDEDARREPYDSSYKNPLPYPATPAAAPRPIDDHQYYPNGNYFPPPPATGPRPEPAPYSPADYPHPPGPVPPQSYDYPSGPGPDPYAPRPRRADENVSASNYPQPTVQDRGFDGVDAQSSLRTPRARRRRSRAASRPPGPKSVVFDIHSEHEGQKDLGYETDDSDSTIGSVHGSRRNRPQARRHSSSEPYSSYKRNDARSGSQGQQNNATESDSDSTVDLPDRFDSHGRLLPQPDDDPLAGRLEQLMRGFNRVFA